jgi:16S rRNA (guanine527-N7)-methyltransferase
VKLAPDLICKAAGIQDIEEKKLALSQRFCDLVLETNRKINLVSRRGNVARQIERQFLLSVAPLGLIPTAEDLRWLDVGSGGGFPAIPLAIFRPDISFVLIESVAKKAFFLERTTEALELPNVSVTNERLAPDGSSRHALPRSFDWVSVKAVAEWETTLLWGRSFLRPRGCLLTYKPRPPCETELVLINSRGFELQSSKPVEGNAQAAKLHIVIVTESSESN